VTQLVSFNYKYCHRSRFPVVGVSVYNSILIIKLKLANDRKAELFRRFLSVFNTSLKEDTVFFLKLYNQPKDYQKLRY
jgi:hypothetical protein